MDSKSLNSNYQILSQSSNCLILKDSRSQSNSYQIQKDFLNLSSSYLIQNGCMNLLKILLKNFHVKIILMELPEYFDPDPEKGNGEASAKHNDKINFIIFAFDFSYIDSEKTCVSQLYPNILYLLAWSDVTKCDKCDIIIKSYHLTCVFL